MIRWRVFRNTISNSAGTIISRGIGFLLTPFILHHLGETYYGLWVLIGSVVTYSLLLENGVQGAVIKYVAEYRAKGDNEQAHSVIATALLCYTALGLLTIILSMALAPLLPSLFGVPPDERATASRLVLLMGVGVGISIPCLTARAVLRGLQRYDIVNLLDVIGAILSAVATLILLSFGWGLLALAGMGIAVTIIMQAPNVWFVYRIAPELRFGWRGASRSQLRTIISFSSSLFVIHFAGRLQTKTDEIVIAAFLPISAVTPYAVSRKLSELAQTLTSQFVRVLLPLSSELHAGNDWNRLRDLYIVSTRLTLAICLPVAGAVILLARPLLTMWIGQAYAEYSHIVVILSIASFINTSQWPAGSVLQGVGRHRFLAVTSSISGLINLFLSILLLPRFGLTGVAVGTLIPTAIECFCFILPYAMRVIGVSLAEVVKGILLPALMPVVPMGLALYFLCQLTTPSSLPAVILVAGIGLILYVVGFLSISANKAELLICLSFARSTLRFAQAHLKRSG